MAGERKRSKSSRLYEDDDEISQSIAEFQRGEVVNTEDNRNEGTIGVDEAFGVASVSEPDAEKSDAEKSDAETGVVSNPAPVIEAPLSKDIKIPECGCCGSRWVIRDGRLHSPGCGCAIQARCPECNKCTPSHCNCKKFVENPNGQ